MRRKLETMTVEEFTGMFNDTGKGHKIKDLKIEAAKIHLPDKKITYGFGYKGKNGMFKQVWEFDSLVKNVFICDWLDYYGFERPKWEPKHIKEFAEYWEDYQTSKSRLNQ